MLLVHDFWYFSKMVQLYYLLYETLSLLVAEISSKQECKQNSPKFIKYLVL